MTGQTAFNQEFEIVRTVKTGPGEYSITTRSDAYGEVTQTVSIIDVHKPVEKDRSPKSQVIRSLGKLAEEVGKLPESDREGIDPLLREILRLLAPSHEEIIELSKLYPAPQEWYDEEF